MSTILAYKDYTRKKPQRNTLNPHKQRDIDITRTSAESAIINARNKLIESLGKFENIELTDKRSLADSVSSFSGFPHLNSNILAVSLMLNRDYSEKIMNGTYDFLRDEPKMRSYLIKVFPEYDRYTHQTIYMIYATIARYLEWYKIPPKDRIIVTFQEITDVSE
jgi:hypothetical protein